MNGGSRPVPFPGTDEQRRLNRATHSFVFEGSPEDGDMRCLGCDCKPGYVSADYPCGEEVPREPW
jgi:hypothetical protein